MISFLPSSYFNHVHLAFFSPPLSLSLFLSLLHCALLITQCCENTLLLAALAKRLVYLIVYCVT